MPELDAEALTRLVRCIVNTRSNEIACEQAFENFDRFVELSLAGTDPSEVLPLVHHHLENCDCCREEYNALLHAMEAINSSRL
jgi:hypothetical protein